MCNSGNAVCNSSNTKSAMVVMLCIKIYRYVALTLNSKVMLKMYTACVAVLPMRDVIVEELNAMPIKKKEASWKFHP